MRLNHLPAHLVAVALAIGAASDSHAQDPPKGDGEENETGEAPREDQPPPEDAPIQDRAQWWFTEGERLGAEGDLLGAAKAFEKSVDLVKTTAGLYNRAVAYEYARELLLAADAYEEYRDELEDGSPEAEAADQAIRGLLAQLGTIELKFERGHVPKQIFVDGVEYKRAEFPMLVLPGPHEVAVIERGGERRERQHEMEAGGKWTVDFARPRAEANNPPIFQPPPQFEDPTIERRRRATRALFYTSAGLTVLGGVGIATFGGLTLRTQRNVKAAACGTKTECEEYEDATGMQPVYPERQIRLFDQYRLATNVSVGVTAGLAAVTLVLGIISFVEPSRDRDEKEGAKVSVTPGGLRMRF
jgi:hypothetical protein